MASVCPNCRAELKEGALAAAVRKGGSIKCEKCGAILRTDDVKREFDKALDDFKKSIPKKFEINFKL